MITLMNKLDDENYIIQPKDVLDIADTFIRENNLEDYLKDVDYNSKSKKLGTYSIKTGIITFNDEIIIKKCYELYDKLLAKYHIDENYYTYYINFYYLSIVYHEFTHVIRRMQYEKTCDKNNISNYLYELSYRLKKEDPNLYKEYHNLFPIEIDANNTGYYKAYSLMSYTKLPSKECKIMQLQYLFSVLYNYDRLNIFRVMTPIEKLAELNPNVDLYKIFDLARQENISKMNRLYLGLPITSREYDGIVKEKQKLLTK